MKMSRRARRMELHHKRSKRTMGLNMVSLMDIFTILVFFLLVNASEVTKLPSTKTIRLPESTAEQKPRDTLTIMVSSADILVQGRRVTTVREALGSADATIGALNKELKYHARRNIRQAGVQAFDGRVTIMGDKVIPYKLLKKIMLTCAQANYPNISLAVLQKPASGESS
ncbi:MAG: biopolymer transporter ExbD [Pseudomonadota bacterium]|nr:MAG: biopolymer transporter ExbD [Pseudomonadota bacterium]